MLMIPKTPSTSANSSGVTLTQELADEDASAPQIIGDIALGSGNDSVTVSAGTITGDLALGAGDDSVSLSGSSTLTGDTSFGGGSASLTLADTAAIVGAVDFGNGGGTLTLTRWRFYSQKRDTDA